MLAYLVYVVVVVVVVFFCFFLLFFLFVFLYFVIEGNSEIPIHFENITSLGAISPILSSVAP